MLRGLTSPNSTIPTSIYNVWKRGCRIYCAIGGYVLFLSYLVIFITFCYIQPKDVSRIFNDLTLHLRPKARNHQVSQLNNIVHSLASAEYVDYQSLLGSVSVKWGYWTSEVS